MGRRKIQDETEVRRWYEVEGWTFRQMADYYDHVYNIQIGQTAFSEMARTRGWERRIVRDPDLIPWAVAERHRWHSILANLRREAKLRAGRPLPAAQQGRWESFRRELEELNAVVYYDPDTDEGFFLIRRSPGDDDIIRRPKQGQRGRGRRDPGGA